MKELNKKKATPPPLLCWDIYSDYLNTLFDRRSFPEQKLAKKKQSKKTK